MDSPDICTVSRLEPPRGILRAGVDLTAREAASLVAVGRLTHLLHGLYASIPPTPDLRAWAIGLHLRPASREALVIHRMSAAWVYGFAPAPSLIECSAPSEDDHRLFLVEQPFCLRRFNGYTPFDDARLGPIRVTTPLRTCVDLALRSPGIRADNALRTMMMAPGLGATADAVVAALRAVPRASHRDAALSRVRGLRAHRLGAEVFPDPRGQFLGVGREPVMR